MINHKEQIGKVIGAILTVFVLMLVMGSIQYYISLIQELNLQGIVFYTILIFIILFKLENIIEGTFDLARTGEIR